MTGYFEYLRQKSLPEHVLTVELLRVNHELLVACHNKTTNYSSPVMCEMTSNQLFQSSLDHQAKVELSSRYNLNTNLLITERACQYYIRAILLQASPAVTELLNKL